MTAAERHFAERGFEAARLEDIAADVGIRRAAIFYYFRDKEQLYAAVLDEIFDAGMATLPAAGNAVGTWDTNLTANFNNGGGNDVFKAFDSVTFDDTVAAAAAKTVNVSGLVAPALVTVAESN